MQAAASPVSTVPPAAGRWVHGPGAEAALHRAWEMHTHASTPINSPSVETAAHAVADGRVLGAGPGAGPGAGAGQAAGEHPEELAVAYGRTLRLPRVCGDAGKRRLG